MTDHFGLTHGFTDISFKRRMDRTGLKSNSPPLSLHGARDKKHHINKSTEQAYKIMIKNCYTSECM